MYILCLLDGIANDVKRGVLAPTTSALIKYGALKYDEVKDGEVWRLLTAALLHGNLAHIVTNTTSILFLLTRIEIIYNPIIIAIFMVLSAIGGTFATYFREHHVSYC